jgi:hypothetical protein
MSNIAVNLYMGIKGIISLIVEFGSIDVDDYAYILSYIECTNLDKLVVKGGLVYEWSSSSRTDVGLFISS